MNSGTEEEEAEEEDEPDSFKYAGQEHEQSVLTLEDLHEDAVGGGDYLADEGVVHKRSSMEAAPTSEDRASRQRGHANTLGEELEEAEAASSDDTLQDDTDTGFVEAKELPEVAVREEESEEELPKEVKKRSADNPDTSATHTAHAFPDDHHHREEQQPKATSQDTTASETAKTMHVGLTEANDDQEEPKLELPPRTLTKRSSRGGLKKQQDILASTASGGEIPGHDDDQKTGPEGQNGASQKGASATR